MGKEFAAFGRGRASGPRSTKRSLRLTSGNGRSCGHEPSRIGLPPTLTGRNLTCRLTL